MNLEAEQTYFMQQALVEAKKAYLINEVPIGAVVVHDGKIVGRGHNLREWLEDATVHAELVAIQEACRTLNSWRLVDCDLYVTIEPCLMCSGAIINSRISRVFYGAPDLKAGAVNSLYQTLTDSRLNHQVEVFSGLYADKSAQLMKDFFKAARKKRKSVK
ncbi:tRNA adenosine(34) deaminase TadA [Lentilactobacillus sp. SPB1-3]|uniref:tRNA adenosine(34) deaminase TadA n=1 Tax=Lentilactobacillus terminaliae TaxID=3003483 RepID=A0ACD5DHJ6_9LACO|nr:tRNA adenosine(34) deaminase TadA [Lentilactobacillus sp. SPB1-3]MCZ0976913.1 tRNA adenosine(34) deaminase TadA [Lentilactobacillus sp. SPB1-3]